MPSSPTPPTSGSSSTPAPSNQPSATNASPAPLSGGGGTPLDQFFASFSPEDHEKFMNILTQNLCNQIQAASQKYVAELQKERQQIESGEESD